MVPPRKRALDMCIHALLPCSSHDLVLTLRREHGVFGRGCVVDLPVHGGIQCSTGVEQNWMAIRPSSLCCKYEGVDTHEMPSSTVDARLCVGYTHGYGSGWSITCRFWCLHIYMARCLSDAISVDLDISRGTSPNVVGNFFSWSESAEKRLTGEANASLHRIGGNYSSSA